MRIVEAEWVILVSFPSERDRRLSKQNSTFEKKNFFVRYSNQKLL